jgi:hypothetical protein
MDPELLAAARKYYEQVSRAKAAGEPPTATEKENYARQLTNRAHGYADMEAILDTLRDDPQGNEASSILSGMTANFGDELVGLLPKFLGGGDAAKEGLRLRQDFQRTEHPKTDAAYGAVGGALTAPALPLGAGLKGASVAERAVQGAGMGALFGGAAGAGAGETEDERLQGAEHGGIAGAALGGVLTPALTSRAASAVANRVANRVANATGKVTAGSSALDPSYAKLDAVRAQLAKAVDQLGGFRAAHDANDALQAAGRGDIARFADLGSPTTDLADFAATNSSRAKKLINDVVDARESSTTQRVVDDFKAAAGDHHAETRIRQLAAETKAWADGPDAYGTRNNGVGLHGANPMVPLGDAEPLVTQPRIKQLFANAKETAQIGPDAEDFATQAMNEARASNPELDSFLAANPKLNVQALLNDPDATAQLEALGKGHLVDALKAADGSAPFDIVQELQQSLRDASSAAFRRGANNLGMKLGDSANVVQRTLEETIPGYADIVDKYAARKGMETAVKLGQELFRKHDVTLIDQAVESMKDKPLLLEEFRRGLAGEQLTKLRGQVGNNAATKLMIAKNNIPQQRINEIVFGDRATYDKFMLQAKAERQLGYLSTAGKGSQTTPRAVRNEQALGLAADVAHEVKKQHPSLRHAVMRKVVDHTVGPMLEHRADELTPFLLRRGHDDIARLLDVLEQTSKSLVDGIGSSRAVTGASGSLFGRRSQD